MSRRMSAPPVARWSQSVVNAQRKGLRRCVDRSRGSPQAGRHYLAGFRYVFHHLSSTIILCTLFQWPPMP
jgi:hypothetical protein